MHIFEDDLYPVPFKCCTPLFIAATCGNVEILRFLVENGANVNATDDFGFTPLMAASDSQFLDAVTFLIDQGADVNLHDSGGFTALHYAIEVSFDPLCCLIVKQLINHGTNINAVTKYDKGTPLMLACGNENVSVVNFLLNLELRWLLQATVDGQPFTLLWMSSMIQPRF